MFEKAKHLQLLQHQLARLQERLDVLHQRSDRLSRWRLLLFAGALLLGAIAFLNWGPVVWLVSTAVLLIPFFVIVYVHKGIETSVTRLNLWQQLKQTQIARMTLAWDGLPAAKTYAVPPDHSFAIDIDLVGEHSLHRLLDTAVSREGSERLHNWLLVQTPASSTVLTRQPLVQELTAKPQFWERLWLRAKHDVRTT